MLDYKDQTEIVGTLDRLMKSWVGFKTAANDEEKKYWKEIYVLQLTRIQEDLPGWKKELNKP